MEAAVALAGLGHLDASVFEVVHDHHLAHLGSTPPHALAQAHANARAPANATALDKAVPAVSSASVDRIRHQGIPSFQGTVAP